MTAYNPAVTSGSRLRHPGLKFKVEGTPEPRSDCSTRRLALWFGAACPRAGALRRRWRV